jgi:hypothetical protein
MVGLATQVASCATAGVAARPRSAAIAGTVSPAGALADNNRARTPFPCAFRVPAPMPSASRPILVANMSPPAESTFRFEGKLAGAAGMVTVVK